ncbi:MAG: sulfotransferase [Anaerolineae bacterium]|nr:sulfotransferase [Anaerolineae bacterium]
MEEIGKETAKQKSQRTKEPRAAFLVGCGRSGTNMITRQLAKSPDVVLFNEDHLDAFAKYRLREIKVIQRLVEQSTAQVVLFKPILDTHLSLHLLEHFPDARLLFAFRHYGDVVNSSIRRFGPLKWTKSVAHWVRDDFARFAAAPLPDVTKERIKSRWRPDLGPESSIALYWLFYNSLFFDLGLNESSRVMSVQYEQTVMEPERRFKALAAFVEIPFTPTMAQGVYASSIGKAARPGIDPQIAATCEALWQRLCLTNGSDST